MQKNTGLILLAFVLVSCIFFMHFSIYATQEQVLINSLIENPGVYDAKTVTITAEAIGECMERGSHAWINVNDGSNAIGIWMTNEEASQISYYGDYRYTGDTIAVTGIFNRACLEHGGEPDIHCESISILKKGSIRKEEISTNKILLAVFFTILGSLLFIVLKRGNRKGPNRN